MSSVSLNLVVLRFRDLDRAADFYSRLLGVAFVQHRHGQGPEHFSVELGGSVFELYPLAKGGQSTLGTRVGFRVPSLEGAIETAGILPEAILAPPKDSEWGRRAVVADPEGHRVELVEG